jgi:hypothetical protein
MFAWVDRLSGSSKLSAGEPFSPFSVSSTPRSDCPAEIIAVSTTACVFVFAFAFSVAFAAHPPAPFLLPFSSPALTLGDIDAPTSLSLGPELGYHDLEDAVVDLGLNAASVAVVG